MRIKDIYEKIGNAIIECQIDQATAAIRNDKVALAKYEYAEKVLTDLAKSLKIIE